jgi:hypothetical protein
MAWQVRAVESALRSAAIEPLPPITPVLCFIDAEWPLFRRPDTYIGVRLEGRRSIKNLLPGPQILDPRKPIADAHPHGGALPISSGVA